MLNYLSINNFVIIDKLEKNFKEGLTTITGETGSGKSIILDALNLITGARSDLKFFKNKEQKIDLIAEFLIEGNFSANKFLNDNNFDSEEKSCIIRRIINEDGKSKAFINSKLCTMSDLKKIGSTLIEIHSQHKSQEILSPEKQIKIIDSFSGLNDQILKLKQLNNLFSKKDNFIKEILSKKEEAQSKLQLLNYKYNELEELDIGEDEIKDLEEEQARLSSADDIINQCKISAELCYGDRDSNSIHSLIREIKNNIEDLKLNDTSILEIIETIEVNVTELNRSLIKESDSCTVDEERLDEINRRLEKAYSLAKKNNVLPEELFDFYHKIKNEIDEINISDEDIDDLKLELKKIKKDWLDLATEISIVRKENAVVFSNKISECLNELKMEGSCFEVVIKNKENKDINSSGIDNVEFMLIANVGQTLQPISSVASGGEISRISLAIQSLVSKNYKIPTLIFDEIDTGIGGTTANVIGKYLKKISLTSQVLCITHLPQVTVYGNHFLTVKKHTSKNSTNSTIEYVSDYELINEIGRMIGNEILDSEAIAQAKKMIQSAKECKLD